MSETLHLAKVEGMKQNNVYVCILISELQNDNNIATLLGIILLI